MFKDKKIVLIGTGRHAENYAVYFKKYGIDIKIIGNSVQSTKKFQSKTQFACFPGGVDSNIKIVRNATHVIICLPSELVIPNLKKSFGRL